MAVLETRLPTNRLEAIVVSPWALIAPPSPTKPDWTLPSRTDPTIVVGDPPRDWIAAPPNPLAVSPRNVLPVTTSDPAGDETMAGPDPRYCGAPPTLSVNVESVTVTGASLRATTPTDRVEVLPRKVLRPITKATSLAEIATPWPAELIPRNWLSRIVTVVIGAEPAPKAEVSANRSPPPPCRCGRHRR